MSLTVPFAIHDARARPIGQLLDEAVAALGSGKSVARLGGGEFAFVITTAKSDSEAQTLLDRR